MRTIAVVWLGALLGCGEAIVGAAGTSDGDGCPLGSMGCPCTDGGACDSSLSCLSGVCVDASSITADSTAGPDVPGTSTSLDDGTTSTTGTSTEGDTTTTSEGGTSSSEGGTSSDDGGTSSSEGTSSDGGTSSSEGTSSEGTSSDGGSTSSSEGTSSDDGGASTESTSSDGGGGMVTDCDSIDILFVIDNSNTMGQEHARLIDSIPSFISALESQLPDGDRHLMVTTTEDGTDAGASTTCISGACTCTAAPICCEAACEVGSSCNGDACNALPIEPCDYTFGAGRRVDQSGDACTVSGLRYVTEDDAPQSTALSCAADVGIHGSMLEVPIHAMLAATSAGMNAPGGCNEGFLRDDAFLVVVIVTNEDDDPPEGTAGDPPEWVESLLQVKGGDPEGIAVFGLVGDGNIFGGTCGPAGTRFNGEANPAVRLQEFILSFPNGAFGSICGNQFQYANFLTEAADAVADACAALPGG